MAKHRISFGSQYKFPLKLYQVVNDGLLMKWTEDGMAVVIEQKEFEENVMQFYPGFVQVKTFHNLRRLFRDYGFKFQVLRRKKPHGLKLVFRHQSFIRDNPHQVLLVRKSKRRYPMHPLAASSPKNSLLTMQAYCHKLAVFKFEGFDSSGNISTDQIDYSLSECNTTENSWDVRDIRFNTGHLDPHSVVRRLASFPADEVSANVCPLNAAHQLATGSNKLTKEDMNILAHILGKNEMSEPEFWEFITRKCRPEWRGKSWDETMKLLNSVVIPELSPLHYKGGYYVFSIDEL